MVLLVELNGTFAGKLPVAKTFMILNGLVAEAKLAPVDVSTGYLCHLSSSTIEKWFVSGQANSFFEVSCVPLVPLNTLHDLVHMIWTLTRFVLFASWPISLTLMPTCNCRGPKVARGRMN